MIPLNPAVVIQVPTWVCVLMLVAFVAWCVWDVYVGQGLRDQLDDHAARIAALEPQPAPQPAPIDVEPPTEPIDPVDTWVRQQSVLARVTYRGAHRA